MPTTDEKVTKVLYKEIRDAIREEILVGKKLYLAIHELDFTHNTHHYIIDVSEKDGWVSIDACEVIGQPTLPEQYVKMWREHMVTLLENMSMSELRESSKIITLPSNSAPNPRLEFTVYSKTSTAFEHLFNCYFNKETC